MGQIVISTRIMDVCKVVPEHTLGTKLFGWHELDSPLTSVLFRTNEGSARQTYSYHLLPKMQAANILPFLLPACTTLHNCIASGIAPATAVDAKCAQQLTTLQHLCLHGVTQESSGETNSVNSSAASAGVSLSAKVLTVVMRR